MMLQPSSAQSSVAKSSSFDRAADDLDAMLKRRLVADDRRTERSGLEVEVIEQRRAILERCLELEVVTSAATHTVPTRL